MTFLLLLLLQLPEFLHPMDYVTANQVYEDVVVTVTYAGELPEKACTTLFAADDVNLITPLESHCWKPTNVVGDFDIWEKRKLFEMGIALCSIYYKNGRNTHMILVYRSS